MKSKSIRKSMYVLFCLLILFSGIRAPILFNLPSASTPSLEYDGCFTFGDENINGISYSPGENPLTYRSGYGSTTILDEKYGHKSVLESDMSSSNIYKEEIILDESYHSNCAPSPTTGVQTVEWWWAFDYISLSDWTPSPTFWIYTDLDTNLADDSSVVYLWWQKPPGYNDQFICQVRSYEGGTSDLYKTANNAGIDLSSTVVADKFYHFRISFDYDSDQITWSVNGEQGWRSETWSTSNLAGQIGNITKIALGAGFSYYSKHWVDSISWSWADNYNVGDLENYEPIEFDGSLTFGDVNYNGTDYNTGDEPFDQLYSFYHNDQLDPNYPIPPYDPKIIGYGIKQHNSYPFNGITEIIAEKDGHKNVLECDAAENGYMEGFNIPDSPSSGNHSIEFWWAWETIDSWVLGNTPMFLIQTDNGYVALRMKTNDPNNRWSLLAKDNSTTTEAQDISTELVTSTINPNEFFRVRISFNLDTNSVTYAVYGDIIVSGSIITPFTIGKIHWISIGTLHSHLSKQWIDSLSWSWDPRYNEGDLLNALEIPPIYPPDLYPIVPNPTYDTTINLDWNDVSDADNYTVYRCSSFINELNGSVQNVGTTVSSSFSDIVSKKGEYYYVITATNETGNSEISNCEGVFADLPVPEAPILSLITPNPDLDGYINLEWDDVLNADNYTVYRHSSFINEINGTVTNLGSPSSSSFIDSSLLNGTYYYAVTAVNETGESDLSNCESVTVDLPGPDAPILSVISPSIDHDGAVLLDWNDVPDSDYYRVYRYTSPITEINGSVNYLVQTVSSSYTNHIGIEGTYYYAVTAYNVYGVSAVSNSEFVTIDFTGPSAPVISPIVPNPNTDGEVYVYWSDVPYADSYTIYRYTSSITTINASLDILGVYTNHSLIDSILYDGNYYYAAIASNETGDSILSNNEHIVVDLPEPDAPELELIMPNPDTDGLILLNWNSVPGAEEYRVYRDATPITDTEGRDFIAQTTTSHYVDEILESGNYYYVVTAVGPGGESIVSNGQEVRVEIPVDRSIPGYTLWILISILGCSCFIMILKWRKKFL